MNSAQIEARSSSR